MKLQNQIIKSLNIKNIIIPNEEINNRTEGLKKYFLSNTNLKSLIVAISGGQDSTLVGKLCQLTIQKIRKLTKIKSYKFIALRLPYGIQADEKDCIDALNFIKPDKIIEINIKEAVLSSTKSLKNAGIIISDFIKGNQKARERMKIQYSIASINNGLIIGTGNAAEIITGFFTKYGDNGVDINLISALNKRQGKLLLKHLNCPKHLYLKTPTADLEDKKPQQPDELILNIKYNEIDEYLEGKRVDIKIQKKIEAMYLKTMHKRKVFFIG